MKQPRVLSATERDRQKKWINRGILASALVALVSVCAIIYLLMDTRRARSAHEDLLEQFVTEDASLTATGSVLNVRGDWDGSGANLQVNFPELMNASGDVVAWLQVPQTTISYPVMHNPDNDFYATHGFGGESDTHGAIFLEATNAPAMTDRNSIIYGHAMRDTTMFGSLRAHFLADAGETLDPFFYLYLPDGRVNRYLVFSYYDTGDSSDTYATFTADDAYDYYVYYAQTLSQAGVTWEELLRSAGVTDPAGAAQEEREGAAADPAEDEREGAAADGVPAPEADSIFAERPPIVTLSTCVGPSGSSRRFVVHGVLAGSVVR